MCHTHLLYLFAYFHLAEDIVNCLDDATHLLLMLFTRWLHLLDSNQPLPVNSRGYSPRILRWNKFVASSTWGLLPRFCIAVYHCMSHRGTKMTSVYFVALAFHLILGIDPRTRTLTDSFGDCSAAITLGGCIILVEQRGFEPLQHY